MGRKSASRAKGAGTVYLDGKLYRARWVVGGKVFTRATGEKDKRAALAKLEEFVRPYQARTDAARMEEAIAQLGGKRAEIQNWEDAQPALTPAAAWSAYLHSQSRPRSGVSTLNSYEQEYSDFCAWLAVNYPEAHELRNVSPEIGKEYARALLTGTPQETRDAIAAARCVLARYAKTHDLSNAPDGEAEGEYRRARKVLAAFAWNPPAVDDSVQDAEPVPPEIQKARYLVSLKVRQPARGTTFNRHMNTLALVWKTLAADMPEKAKLGENPFAWDKTTGRGIRRITLKHGERPHRRQDLNLEEIATLLKTAKGEMRVLIALGFYTGLRLGDCVLMDWGKIDRVNGLIITRSVKTDIETRTRVNPALARIITEEVKVKKGYIMPELAELYASGKSGRAEVSRRVILLFQSAGISTTFDAGDGRRARADKTFHSLRHAYITQLERVGVTLRERQALAGHGTEAMTAYYTHEDGAGALALPDLTDGAGAAADALESPVEREDGVGGAMMPPNAGTRLQAFKTAFGALSASERKAALAWIAETPLAPMNHK